LIRAFKPALILRHYILVMIYSVMNDGYKNKPFKAKAAPNLSVRHQMMYFLLHFLSSLQSYADFSIGIRDRETQFIWILRCSFSGKAAR
jgi:hypothetical protein